MKLLKEARSLFLLWHKLFLFPVDEVKQIKIYPFFDSLFQFFLCRQVFQAFTSFPPEAIYQQWKHTIAYIEAR